MAKRGRKPGRSGQAGAARRRQAAPARSVMQAFDRGLRCSQAGDDAAAAAAFGEAARLQPELHQAHFNLGRALARLGRDGDAQQAFRRTLALKPDHVKAMGRLAGLAARSGDLPGAAALWARALALEPDSFEYLNDYGVALMRLGRMDEARAALERALALAPERAVAHFNLGKLARTLHGDEPAIAHFERAVELDPAYARAWESLGAACHRAAPERAVQCYREALAHDPDLQAARYGLLAFGLRGCDFDLVDESVGRIADALTRGAAADASWQACANLLYLSMFAPLPAAAARALQRRIADALALHTQTPAASAAPRPATTADRRIRVAYLSPNFGDHPVGHVTLSLFPGHDRTRFDITGLSSSRRGSDASAYALRHRRSFDAFHEIGHLQPREAADFVRSLGIDILVDLDGYMDTSSPPLLALRPAPVQVFWLGHAGGLGLPFVDYLIADRHVVPPGDEAGYREAVVRLPETYHCADRHPVAADCAPRAAWGLPEAGVVFCAFNNPDKIDRRVFDCWLRILRAVDGSVLWLTPFRQDRATLVANCSRHAQARGVDPSRLVFAERVPDKATHLARIAHADLMLDTGTLNASTTALDALWAGVPLLALRGERFSNRISTSMLHAIGLADCVCTDLAGYESRAIALARDPAARADLRARLHANRASTPLFDIARFTRHLERAFEVMWAHHGRGEPPAGFDLAPLSGR